LLSRFSPVKLDSVHRKNLTVGDKKSLRKIIEAAMLMDKLWARQMWSESEKFTFLLDQNIDANSDLYKYVMINKGPWSSLDEGQCFIPQDSKLSMSIPNTPPDGANFYPIDMKKEEFENWVENLSDNEKKAARGYFHVITRDEDGKLKSKPYSEEYNDLLSQAASLLQEASELTENNSLKNFLKSRGNAFLSNDYYESDVSWLHLDAPIDVTIGPYEVYQDKLFNAKSSFEAFVGIRDDEETKKLEMFQSMMQELEDNLPEDKKYKNTNVKMNTPIKVIELIFAGGDVGGCQTIAFCLPNDERVVRDHGSKLILLKNVSSAKHELIMEPIAKECVCNDQVHLVHFESFFTHTLCHECCHSIGPHDLLNGKTVRSSMEELHSALEEAKADIVGLWALQYLMDKKMVNKELEESIYVSFMVGAIRSIRFGLDEAHGKGLAVQFNYLFSKKAFLFDEEERKFRVDFSCVKENVRDLASIILTIQGDGDKLAAGKLLAEHGIISENLKECLDRLGNVPVDIAPEYPAAFNVC